MDINKVLFAFSVLYIVICIGTFIRCKSYGIANNIAVCFLIAIPPVLLCFIFFFPILIIRKKNSETYWNYIKKYLHAVSIMLRLSPLIVLGLGLGCENIVNKLTGKKNTSDKNIYFKDLFLALKTYVFQY